MQTTQQVLSNQICFPALRDAIPLPDTVWVVDADRTHYPAADFTTISEAITAASPYDTILVFPGTYAEPVTISKPLTIYGQGAYLHPDPPMRRGGESRIADQFCVTITSSHVTLAGFELTDFYHGITIPEAAFTEPDYALTDITLSYNWLHAEDAWVGIVAQGGNLHNYEVSHSIIDLYRAPTQTPAYTIACVSFSQHATVDPHYTNIVIRSNILRNRSGQYDLFAGAEPARYTMDHVTIECNHFLNTNQPTPADGASFNIGNISDGRFESNLIEDAPGSIGLVHGTIRGNSFLRGGGLKLWGSEYGFTRPSADVRIENNEFSGEIYGNALHLRTGSHADTITSRYNCFADSGITPESLLDLEKGQLLRNDTSQTHDATWNWWDSGTGPSGNHGKITGPATTSPWIEACHPVCDCRERLCWPLSTCRRHRTGFYPRVITGITYVGDTCFDPCECVALDFLVSFHGGQGCNIPIDISVDRCHYHTCTSRGGTACLSLHCLSRGTHTVVAQTSGTSVTVSIHIRDTCS